MQTQDLISLATACTGVAGIGIAVWALSVSKRANKHSAEANEISKQANDHAREAIEVSKDSAESARRSADEAAKTASLELERRHDDLRPVLPATIEAEAEDSTLRPGRKHLSGTITVPRRYRVTAFALIGLSAAPISLPLLLTANRPERFYFEELLEGQREAKVEEILFRFWPPTEHDKGEVWACPCGRPTDHTSEMSGAAHWEVRVGISYYDVMDSIL